MNTPAPDGIDRELLRTATGVAETLAGSLTFVRRLSEAEQAILVRQIAVAAVAVAVVLLLVEAQADLTRSAGKLIIQFLALGWPQQEQELSQEEQARRLAKYFGGLSAADIPSRLHCRCESLKRTCSGRPAHNSSFGCN